MPLSWPTSAEISLIERDLYPDLSLVDPIFSIFPVADRKGWSVIWDQMDNVVGLQQARGLGGAPPVVKPLGSKQWNITPGVYGEYIPLTEEEMLTRRLLGTFADPADVQELSMMKIQQLMARRIARYKWLGWTLLNSGTYTVLGPTGPVMHTDTFKFQQYTASILWSSLSTAAPIGDFQAVNILHRGHSVSFGPDSNAWMNTSTFNYLYRNSNAADVGGRRLPYGQTINTAEDFNRFYQGAGLPSIKIYDDGYLDDNGVFQLWIPTGKIDLVGRRTNGAPVGNILQMGNVNNPGNAPGPYSRVIDKGDYEVPRSIEFHDGANVAPVVWYPSSIVEMTVA